VLKDATRAELLAAVRQVLRGEQALNGGLAARLLQRMARATPSGSYQETARLTARELDVLRLLVQPTPAVADLAGDTGIRLLTLGAEQHSLLAVYGDMYSARTIATSVYQLPEQVNTIGIPNVLVVRADMPEETARRLTELLFDAKPRLVAAHVEARRLEQRAALSTYPVPLHPGAARYYRDTKIMAAAP
jgi:TRAP transporter TAXI family solute receptor